MLLPTDDDGLFLVFLLEGLAAVAGKFYYKTLSFVFPVIATKSLSIPRNKRVERTTTDDPLEEEEEKRQERDANITNRTRK